MYASMANFGFVLCFFVVFGQLNASAIPMWEFLSKQEKMSFLYSQFANQVDSFCETSTLKDCNKALLKYGLKTLKNMPEEVLDATDPYQRGANSIIWETLLKGHTLAKTHPKPQSTSTTAKPNSYDDDESFGDDTYDDFGSESAASAKIDNVYRVPPPKGFVVEFESGDSEYIYPKNVGAFLNSFDGPVMDREAYEKFTEPVTTTSSSDVESVPLTGPLVVRVYPNGTPVDEELPSVYDEDLRQHKMAHVPLPNL